MVKSHVNPGYAKELVLSDLIRTDRDIENSGYMKDSEVGSEIHKEWSEINGVAV